MDNPNRILAIVCAKKDSERFPGKNIRLIENVLRELCTVRGEIDTVVATDDKWIEHLCGAFNVKHLFRNENCAEPEDSVFNVARWAYYCLNQTYWYVAVVLPNVTNFKAPPILHGAKMISDSQSTEVTDYDRNGLGLRDCELREVRTYDKDGIENGLIVMSQQRFLNEPISTYCGAITTEAREIHRESELEEES